MKKFIFMTMLVSLICIMGNKSNASVSGEGSNWTLAKSTGNVEFSYKMSECNGEKVIFLKFENKNDYGVKVSWKEAVTDRVFNETVEGFYGEKQIVLQAGATLEGDCTASVCNECLVYVSKIVPTHPADPSNFEFRDITVSKTTN